LKAQTALIYYICIVNALQIIATRTARKNVVQEMFWFLQPWIQALLNYLTY